MESMAIAASRLSWPPWDTRVVDNRLHRLMREAGLRVRSRKLAAGFQQPTSALGWLQSQGNESERDGDVQPEFFAFRSVLHVELVLVTALDIQAAGCGVSELRAERGRAALEVA